MLRSSRPPARFHIFKSFSFVTLDTSSAPTSAATNPNPFEPPADPNVLSLGGLLGKAADTALEVWQHKQDGKSIGTVYPTGQVNPAAAPAMAGATPAAATAAGGGIPPNLKPYLIAGGVALALVVLLAVARR